MVTPRTLVRTMIDARVGTRQTIEGCSPGELRVIAKDAGAPLPAAYRSLMRQVGRRCGCLFEQSTFCYPGVIGLTQWVREQLEGAVRIPADGFCFLNHLGYSTLFFRLSAGDDPPIYHWSDDNPHKLVRVKQRLWRLVEEEIEYAAGIVRVLEGSRASRKRS
jgi:hypothetical protein